MPAHFEPTFAQESGARPPLSQRGGNRYRAALVAALGVSALVTVYGSPMNPNLTYKTDPPNPFFDQVVWPIPRVLMDTKANGKLTHDPHWYKKPLASDLQGIMIQGDPSVMERENFWNNGSINLSKPLISLGAWPNVILLEPEEPEKPWHYGFTGPSKSGELEICRIEITGPLRVLQGRWDYYAFGLNKLGEEVPIKATGPFSRHDRSIPGPII